jgi:thiosulfate dehydrogenase
MKGTAALVVLGLIVALFAFSCGRKSQEPAGDPAAELAMSAGRGHELFNDAKLGTSGMTCSSCHLEGGTRSSQMGEMTIRPFDHISSKYPGYFNPAKRVMTLEQVVNNRITNPLKGEALSWDNQKLADLAAYLVSVKTLEKAEIPADTAAAVALVKAVTDGQKLFNDASLGTSGTSCNSCHIDGGTKPGKMGEMPVRAFDDLRSKYPGYNAMAKKVMGLDQANNWCIVNPLKGQPLVWDDPRLTALAAFVVSVKPVQ